MSARIATVLGVDEVRDLTRLSGGASRETWRFVVDGRPLVLQRQRPGADRDMAVEVRVLRAARAAGVPVPAVVAADSDPGPLDAAFMILEHVDGETIARKILRDVEFEGARRQLAAQLGRALAALHRIDPGSVPGLMLTDQVSQYRDVLDALGQPHPTFELALRWLDEHRPPAGRVAVVHGDFRLGNVIVGPDGLRAVLDWELAHLGDPMEDLGWLCVRAWRFGAPGPVAGLADYADLFDAYTEASGTPVEPAVVRWWEVLGTLKWGIMCIMQAHGHRAGLTRSHELAAIGRRVCENEYDLFRALEDVW